MKVRRWDLDSNLIRFYEKNSLYEGKRYPVARSAFFREYIVTNPISLSSPPSMPVAAMSEMVSKPWPEFCGRPPPGHRSLAGPPRRTPDTTPPSPRTPLLTSLSALPSLSQLQPGFASKYLCGFRLLGSSYVRPLLFPRTVVEAEAEQLFRANTPAAGPGVQLVACARATEDTGTPLAGTFEFSKILKSKVPSPQ